MWTDLLRLPPSMAGKRGPWKLHDCVHPSQFIPEKHSRRVLISVPPGWQVADNVQWALSISSVSALRTKAHVQVFDSNRYIDGFGERPVLTFMIPSVHMWTGGSMNDSRMKPQSAPGHSTRHCRFSHGRYPAQSSDVSHSILQGAHKPSWYEEIST